MPFAPRLRSASPTLFAITLFAALATPTRATVLTFEILDNLGNPYPNGNIALQSYGDNVTDFTPAGLIDNHFYTYGSAGGFTPDIAVEYRYYHPTNTADDGLTSMTYYRTQPGDNFGDLPHVLYTAQPVPYLVEIRFIPANGQAVGLASFDLAGYLVDRTVPTIAAVLDINTASETTLWSAPDNTVISGSTHNHFTPMVFAETGHTLSLIYGADAGGVRGISNITFFQVPEPASLALLTAGLAATVARRRKR